MVWDRHPLSIVATPKQVFTDGVATLDPTKVEASSAHVVVAQGVDAHVGAGEPAMRATLAREESERLGSGSRDRGGGLVISGIARSFLGEFPKPLMTGVGAAQPARDNPATAIVDGRAACLGGGHRAPRAHDGGERVKVRNGHLSRGLTAVTSSLGRRSARTRPRVTCSRRTSHARCAGEDARVNVEAVSVVIAKTRGLIRAGSKKALKESGEGDFDKGPWVLVAYGSLPSVIKADSNVSLLFFEKI